MNFVIMLDSQRNFTRKVSSLLEARTQLESVNSPEPKKHIKKRYLLKVQLFSYKGNNIRQGLKLATNKIVDRSS